MHKHSRSPATGSVAAVLSIRLLLSCLVMVAVLIAPLAANASAAEGNQYELKGEDAQYGETTRFGGFDSTWFDGGAYDGKGGSPGEAEPKPGLFLDPVGFAVDPEDASVKTEDHCASGADENAIWVLDRTDETETDTSWRLQKLDDCGEVLGITEFTLPYNEETPSFVEGLAVDPKTSKIYALVIKHDESAETAVAQEVLDWSTTPASTKVTVDGESLKTLVAPAGSASDKLTTPRTGYTAPGLLSGEATLDETETQETYHSRLFAPQGIAIDDDASGDYLAIEAAASAEETGPTIIQRVSQATGKLGSYWDSKTGLDGAKAASGELETLPNACTGAEAPVKICDQAAGEDSPAGLAADPATGGLTVLLGPGGQDAAEEEPYNTEVVSLNSELGAAKLLSSEPLSGEKQSLKNYDGAALEEYQPPFVQRRKKDVQAIAPSAPVTALTNGLYAAMFFNGAREDIQQGGGPTYWTDADGFNGPGAQAVNLAVRLLDPERESEGTLAGPEPLSSVFDTLGQETGEVGDPTPPVAAGKACNINAVASVAPGAGGSVWVITRGIDSEKGESTAGRQVIELAPAKGTSCPSPSGTFEIEGQPASVTTPLTVTAGATVTFDAEGIDYKGGTPYAYEWTQVREAGSGQTLAESVMNEAEGFHWPSPKTTYRYTEPGVYKVQLKLLGDYGEYVESGLVDVQTTEKPKAEFKASPETAAVGSAITFEAIEAKPTEITDYIWSFGDGKTVETKTSSVSHPYAAAGTYTVSLTVRDSNGQESAPASHTVTVTAPAPTPVPPPPPGGGGNTIVPPPGGVITNPLTIDRSPTNVSPIATAGKDEVKLTVSCPTTKTLCAGTVEVRTASAVSVGKAKKGKKAKKVLELARGSFSLTPGQKKTLTLTLSASGRSMLAKDHSLKLSIVAAAHDAYGDPLTKTLGLTLHSTAKKKSKGHASKKKH